MTEAMHSQMTAAELHERLTEAEAILKRIASSEISEREGGHAMALSNEAAAYFKGGRDNG